MEFLLDRGAVIDRATEKKRQTALHIAFSKNSLAMVRLLLDKGAAIDSTDQSGRTMLQNAVLKGNKEMARLLLDQGAEIVRNAGTNFQTNALHIATSNSDNKDLVELLLDYGAVIDFPDPDGRTALHIATSHDALEIVHLLLDRGAAVDAGMYGVTALHGATIVGNLEVVRVLLDREANINAVDKRSGSTGLLNAISRGHLEVVRLLLDRGASLEIADAHGQTALHKAAFTRNRDFHFDVLQLLLDRGAAVAATDMNGETALHIASSCIEVHATYMFENEKRDAEVKTVQLFLDKGAAINAVNKSGQTALHKAVTGVSDDVPKLLLDRGASLDAVDEDGRTALYVAAGFDRLATVRLLLIRGAAVDAVDMEGISALQVANEYKVFHALFEEALGWQRVSSFVHFLQTTGFSSGQWSVRHSYHGLDMLSPPATQSSSRQSSGSSGSNIRRPTVTKMCRDVLHNRDLCRIISAYIPVAESLRQTSADLKQFIQFTGFIQSIPGGAVVTKRRRLLVREYGM